MFRVSGAAPDITYNLDLVECISSKVDSVILQITFSVISYQ